ncbi:MAG: zinc ribbon domain-containing protein [Deltaproteobacteria bacterium]|jgi:putative regulatory protein, FmdB family|uniref:Zinc ribbon domain-containing protein n=1 Tax=Candidatus Acidulodesulfobacterium acidiphilum TaxID=2597224 RepID=A0A520X9N9_9DELT|nr:zinc ribbon domain-containing protein [Deltaproteobacteria bacterium]RZV37868.1 MAG: zinc ribbon domain-containing protein [Candidatus Acidulodesulfobacterium acidiphilum]
MPIREYKCKDCGNYIEVIQGMNEKPLEKCEKCGGKLEKLISNSSFVLKGSGWYKTDYASSGSSASGSKSKKTADESKTASPAPACSCSGGTCGH